MGRLHQTVLLVSVICNQDLDKDNSIEFCYNLENENKKVYGTSQSTQLKVLGYSFEDPIVTTDNNVKSLAKTNNKFGSEYEVQGLDLEMLKTLGYVPNNFSRLFGLAEEVHVTAII